MSTIGRPGPVGTIIWDTPVTRRSQRTIYPDIYPWGSQEAPSITPFGSLGVPYEPQDLSVNPFEVVNTPRSVFDHVDNLLRQEERDTPYLKKFTSLKSLLISQDLTLPKINWLLSHATPSTNFWGTRSIQITENESSDSLQLSDIAERITAFAKKSGELNMRDCAAGIQCIKKMREFYKKTDVMIDQSNCITRSSEFFRQSIEATRKILQFLGFTFFCRGFPYYSPRDEMEIDNINYSIGPLNPEDKLLQRMYKLGRQTLR